MMKKDNSHLIWNKQKQYQESVDKYHTKMVKEYILPNGKPKTAFLSGTGEYVVGFAVTPDCLETILVKEYRPGPERLVTDLPCGSLNQGEDPAVGMMRELREETGFSGDIEFINTCHTGPYSTQLRHTFFIKNCVKVGEQKLDLDEFIEVVKMPISLFINELLLSGLTINSAAAFFALEKLGLFNVKTSL